MGIRGVFTREEISAQPEAWRQTGEVLERHGEALKDFIREGAYQQVLFTGCGSTYYLSLAAATTFQEMTGLKCCGLPASEVWLSAGSICSMPAPTLLIAISRSGETTETLRACEAFRSGKRGKILTLVCDQGSELARVGNLNLVFPSGMEKSVAQTKAFSTLYLGTIALSAVWSGLHDDFNEFDQLALSGERILAHYWPMAHERGSNLEMDRIYFLGSGGRFGLACELNLKMKEMSLTHSEAFHFLEFRHGPKAMVNRQTLIVGLVSEANARHEKAVLKDMQDLGAEIITVGEKDTDVSFNSGLKEVTRNVLYLPFGQMMAYERAIAKGLDPDRPHNLDPVVKLAK